MKWIHLLPCFAILLCVSAANAEGEVTAEVEVVSTGDFKFTEGPALAPDGSIYFSDIPNDAIHRYDPATGGTTLFTDDSGGANGLLIFQRSADEAVLVACESKRRAVVTYELPEPASRKVWVDSFNGKRLNSPNDITIMYPVLVFTDPRYGNQEDREIDQEHVFIIPVRPGGQQEVLPLPAVAQKPNGIVHCSKTSRLFIADHGGKKLLSVPFFFGKNPLDTTAEEFEDFADLADLGGPDGMCVDAKGRLYVAIYGKGILILSAEGERLGFIETGPQTTNCCLGEDGRTLYVTAEKALKRVTLHGLDG